MRIVFWQNIISPHLSPLIRALADRVEQVILVAREDLTADRKAIGWSVPHLGRAQVEIGPDTPTVVALAAAEPSESIHILGDIRWHSIGKLAIRHAIDVGSRLGLISEAADDSGWQGIVRLAKYSTNCCISGRHLDFIFAMGQQGVRWFQRSGYAPTRIFPFAYFTEAQQIAIPYSIASYTDEPEMLFLGQCIPRKGIDILLDALANLTHLPWRLTIIGDGPFKASFENHARHIGLNDRVRFLPAMDNAKALSTLCHADMLVLPSRFDGWGAVINEALMCGVPVVCSDRCGAADLLRAPWRGAVFSAGSINSLSTVLAPWLAKGKKALIATQRIRDWARCLDGDAAADYLLAVLQHVYQDAPCPPPPWYDTADTGNEEEHVTRTDNR